MLERVVGRAPLAGWQLFRRARLAKPAVGWFGVCLLLLMGGLCCTPRPEIGRMEGHVSQDLDELVFVLGSTRKELLSRVLTRDAMRAKGVSITFLDFDARAAQEETIQFDQLSYVVGNKKLATLLVGIRWAPDKGERISKAYEALRKAGRSYRIEECPDKLLVDISRPDSPPLTCVLDPVETRELWTATFGLTDHVKRELANKRKGIDRPPIPMWPEGSEPKAIPKVCGIPIPLGIGGRRLYDYIVGSGMAPYDFGPIGMPVRLHGNTRILFETLFYHFAGQETVTIIWGVAVGDRYALSSLFASLRRKGRIVEEAEKKGSKSFTSLVSGSESTPAGQLQVDWTFGEDSRECNMFVVTLAPED